MNYANGPPAPKFAYEMSHTHAKPQTIHSVQRLPSNRLISIKLTEKKNYFICISVVYTFVSCRIICIGNVDDFKWKSISFIPCPCWPSRPMTNHFMQITPPQKKNLNKFFFQSKWHNVEEDGWNANGPGARAENATWNDKVEAARWNRIPVHLTSRPWTQSNYSLRRRHRRSSPSLTGSWIVISRIIAKKEPLDPEKDFAGSDKTDAPTPSSGSRNNRALETTREIQKFRGKFNFQPKPSIGVVRNYKLKSTPSSGSWNKPRHLAAKKDTKWMK